MGDEAKRFPAVLTLAVTASGLTLFGIGSAFWGLLAGLVAVGLDALAKRMRR
jgi:benzoate membrane transport protein